VLGTAVSRVATDEPIETPLGGQTRAGPKQALAPVVKVRGVGGLSPPASTLAEFGPLLESEPSLPTAGPKLLNSTKNHNVRCRINKF